MYISKQPTVACKHPENQEEKQLLKNFDCSVNFFIFVKKSFPPSFQTFDFFFILPQPRFRVTNPTKPGNRGGLFG